MKNISYTITIMKLLLVLWLLLLSGCSKGSKDSDWTAFVYPDIKNIPGSEQAHSFTIGNYSTFEECQEAAIYSVRSNLESTGFQGDYQCGYKCSYRDEFGGMFICKDIRK